MPIFALVASASAAELTFACGDGDPIVGLPGLVVNCVASPPPGAVYDEVAWRFGDGATATGLTVSHTYELEGQFTVSASLEGYVPGDTGEDFVAESEAFGLVTVCGPPEPRFEWEFKGGLDVQLLNRTPPDPRCIHAVQWDIFEGSGTSGEPVFTFNTWEPDFTFEREGTHTVVLTVGGVAGTEAWLAELDAHYGLPDKLHEGALPVACDSAAGAGSLGLLPAALLAWRRRRR